jgi:hypothetical protein
VARLKASARLVSAVDAEVRFYEDPPTEAVEVTTPWSEVWVDADDWAVAFDAPDPGTPHNEARELIWDELLTIILDKYDGEEVAEDLLRRTLRRDEELRTSLERAWPRPWFAVPHTTAQWTPAPKNTPQGARTKASLPLLVASTTSRIPCLNSFPKPCPDGVCPSTLGLPWGLIGSPSFRVARMKGRGASCKALGRCEQKGCWM